MPFLLFLKTTQLPCCRCLDTIAHSSLLLSLSLSLTPPHISSFLLLHANRRFIEELLAFAMAAFLLRSISQNGDDEQQLLVVVVTPDTAMRRRSRD
jgi:hypothetical protein